MFSGLPKESQKLDVPKPYTVPEGYVPPSLAEQWSYAMRKHPYARNAGGGALLLGLIAWGVTEWQRKDKLEQGSSEKDDCTGAVTSGN